MAGATEAVQGFGLGTSGRRVSAPANSNPFNRGASRNSVALQAERERDALAAMQALQRRMRDAQLAQPAWRLPDRKRRA